MSGGLWVWNESLLALTVVLSFLFVLVGGKTLDWLVSAFGARAFFFLLVSPGVVLHEVAHAVMGLVLGVPISRVTLFWPRKEGDRYVLGSVTHAQSDTLSGFLLAIAPFFVGVVASSLLLFFLVLGGSGSPYSWRNWTEALGPGKLVANLASWKFYLGWYLLFCVSVTAAPSEVDLEGWWKGFALFFFLVLQPLCLFGGRVFGGVLLAFVLSLALTFAINQVVLFIGKWGFQGAKALRGRWRS
ncbi:MAG: hypothetical protein QXH08_00075 [Candidatus Hadarchaeales archaeon]